MKEQITEKFAKELLNTFKDVIGDEFIEFVIKRWKELGYIKQSREEEIRDELDDLRPNAWISHRFFGYINDLKDELIEILEGKLEVCKHNVKHEKKID